LNHFVSLPPEWGQPGGSGFDRFKIEYLDFGAYNRNLDWCLQCMLLPITLGWPANLVSNISAAFQPGYAYLKEVAGARELGFRGITMWAFDHVNLYGLSVLPGGQKRGFYM
jgi:hypothetical protein